MKRRWHKMGDKIRFLFRKKEVGYCWQRIFDTVKVIHRVVMEIFIKCCNFVTWGEVWNADTRNIYKYAKEWQERMKVQQVAAEQVYAELDEKLQKFKILRYLSKV